MTITKATPLDAGCYVSGWCGQYGIAQMIKVAEQFGYDDVQAVELANRHLDDSELSDDEYAALSDAADDAEQWLNDNVAPDDYYFGWYEGEFYLASVDWWSEDSGL